jgi:5-methylcytosine-specific restriction protein B
MLYCEINGGKLKESDGRIILIDKNGNKVGHTISGRISYGCAIYNELKELAGIGKYEDNNINIKNIKPKPEKLKNLNYEKIKQDVINAIENRELTKKDFHDAPKHYLIIDEINRGNISNILGELITLLEKDKRLGEDNEIITTLPYSKEPFAVPPNLHIIGTMNTADRSIALLDIALRRRFGFMEIEPNYKALQDKNIKGVNLAKLLETLNKKIVKSIDKDHRIGHSYFLKVENIEDLKFVWYYEIIPLLEEYFYGDFEGLKKVIGDFIKDGEINKGLDGDEFITALNGIIENS